MHRRHLSSCDHERAAALVIVLAFVVLVTLLVVASLSRTQADRAVAHGSFNQSKVDQLAASAAEIIIGDLRQEIVDGSTANSDAAPTTYIPKSVGARTANENMLPVRNGAVGTPNLVRISAGSDGIVAPGTSTRASAVNSTTDSSANGRSVSLARWNTHYLLPRYDPSSTTIDSTPASPLDSPFNPNPSVVGGFVPPDWVILTRSGPAAFGAWNPELADLTKDTFAVGRYAYAIYDEGGLLDINVAGYPSPAPAPPTSYVTDIGRKGVLAFADLISLPVSTANPPATLGAGAVNSIVGWRNFATTQQTGSNYPNFAFTATTTGLYDDYAIANTNGFMKVNNVVWSKSGSNPNPRTDQAFVSRQQLLEVRRSIGFTQNALQYLGTFSREIAGPTWTPPLDAPPPSTYAYKTRADDPTAFNRNLANVRVAQTFPRADGTMAAVGEPLIKKRFPLSRLALITPTATDTGTGLIYKYFGLTRASSTDPWIYNHGAPDRILRLGPVTGGSNDVLDFNREPDFFELLQAVILNGSLGQDTGGGVTGGTAVFPDIHMNKLTHHILSIGACIIDQYDTDSIPTRIQYQEAGQTGLWTAYGVENLPYINQIYPIAGISPDDPLKTTAPTTWATYLLFQLWNPTQQPTTAPVRPNVRLRVEGDIALFTTGTGVAAYTSGSGPKFQGTGQSIQVDQDAFQTPTPLTNDGSSSFKSTANSIPNTTFKRLPTPASGTAIDNYVGLRLPDYVNTSVSAAPNPTLNLAVGADSSHSFNATLEVEAGSIAEPYTDTNGNGKHDPNEPFTDLNGNGVWDAAVPVYVPYNHFIGINDTKSWINGAQIPVRKSNSFSGKPSTSVDQFNTGRLTQSPPSSLMKADPRATRFGIFELTTASTSRITQSLWPSGQTSGYGGLISPSNASGVVAHVPVRFDSSTLPYYPATFCRNTESSSSTSTSYTDPDGIQRAADSQYRDPTNSAVGSSTPYYTTSKDYWPIILNRPFRNVGELGYAFRDLPWRTLDLFSQDSADAGLLDVFTINDEPDIVAGRVNLNTRQAPVIQAILSAAGWDELSTAASTTVDSNGQSATTAATMASNLVRTAVGANPSLPLVNKGDIINRAGLLNAILPATVGGNQAVKARREVLPRAISSMAQTRTWNLMIDVIAQSGRYGPNAATAPNAAKPLANFNVEGEQRYWVHVAIDRFTGQVIDRQVEVVKE